MKDHSFAEVNPFSEEERHPESKKSRELDMSDLNDPAVRRERLFSQDQRILEAVSALGTKVKACPADPKYPEHEPAVLIVGGFARDALIGKHPKDADVEVYGLSPERLEELLDQLYENRVNKVGRAFGIFKVAVGEGVEIDISIPRRESKVGAGHTGFEVTGDPTMSIQEAARRRDFTFNALAVDPLTGTFTDHFGGIEDLKNRTLRVTDEKRFQDDPLRVYRALQFAARLHLNTEEKTFALMKQMVDRGHLDELTTERITEEWKKLLLKSGKPSIGLKLAKDLGIIERYYSELSGTDSWQATDSAARVIHKEGSHLTENEQLQVMLATLCAHEASQSKVSKGFLSKSSFSKKEVIHPTQSLIKECAEPTRIWKAFESGELNEKQVKNEIRKVVKRVHPASPEALLALAKAQDQTSIDTNAGDIYQPALLFRKYLTTHPEWLDPKKSILITGEELKSLGVPPGPKMGQLMRQIEAARDRGEIELREEALCWLSEQRE